eukprot:TRINITY_DN75937_c0_g1_i1.p1 TRINITY_DN75937_c0_g1~~TRINITY_DN75937_c0_g1_i1.p1  ORF type:complete len:281 (+),score=69.74 TRINITY_DN75937_c0_g1_i1:82-924(+)
MTSAEAATSSARALASNMASSSSGLPCFTGLSKLVGSKASSTDGSKSRQEAVQTMAPEQAVARISLPGGRLDRIPEVLPDLAGSDKQADDAFIVHCVGAESLRHFWARFAALELSSQDSSSTRPWTRSEWKVLRQLRCRCLAATAPFQLVLRLLEENWEAAGREKEDELLRQVTAQTSVEALKQAREAIAASKTSEQWSVLTAVQHLIGREPGETAPAIKDIQQELPRRRQRLLSQARMFLLIAGLLESRDWKQPGSRADLKQLIAVQNLVPFEWRCRAF